MPLFSQCSDTLWAQQPALHAQATRFEEVCVGLGRTGVSRKRETKFNNSAMSAMKWMNVGTK
jgi:hypothetical protein